MNLYKYHKNAHELYGHSKSSDIAEVMWDTHKKDIPHLIKHELLFTKNSKQAYLFALHTKRKFDKGEKVISADPWYSLLYASNILKAPFPKGESVIANSEYANQYSKSFPQRKAALEKLGAKT